MEDTENRILGYVIGVVLIFGVIYLSIDFWDKHEYFDNPDAEKRVVIAVVSDILVGGKVSPRFEYKFTVNEIEYISSHNLPNELSIKPRSELKEYVGDRFYVKYSVEKPKFSYLLLNHR